ncbi:phosphopantetheine-binding protein [Streptomyces netropsis]|uniref:Acyl carrier protein n=1 Tax=Streptomyces netropsis TaxID=55404 RepID=A0A7W7PD77_STRNE|nr:phosphopantetheine-binding protein [Streptomyces netropsis]MBB4884330.1 acyl carrier protein [Streptomyces netropsis]GGR04464.1 hypothetical protein GCM10010219_05880 [Streptomyces netropsis]
MPADRIVDGIIDIFRRVLETDGVHADSDFFETGGDSLLATRVLSAIVRDHGTELTIAEFIESPTPSTLAKRIESVTR